MNIAFAQMDIAWLDPRANLAKISRFIDEASQGGAEIVLFPEMCLTGFSMEPEKAAVAENGPEIQALIDLTRKSDAVVIAGAAVRDDRGRYTNRALVMKRGKLLGDYSKINLFSFSGEHNSYSNGSGLLLFEHKGAVFCPLICYDLRFPELFLRAAGEVTGAFLVIANWPKSRAAHWKTLLKARALDSQAAVIGVNRVGSGGSLDYVGDSSAFTAKGEQCVDFSDGEQLLTMDLDLAEAARFRKAFTVLADRERLVNQLPGITINRVQEWE